MQRKAQWTKRHGVVTVAVGILVGTACEIHASSHCDPPPVPALLPASATNGSVIAWGATSGATAYRIRVQTRIPNGRVLAEHDATARELSVSLSQALTRRRVKISVRLIAICAKETSAETVSWFAIDTSLTCTKPRTEKRVYAVFDGRLLPAGKARTIPHVESTRLICGKTRSEATYRVVTGN